MKEYVIHAKLKNNLLLSRILENHKNVAQFCKAHGLRMSEVGRFINLKEPAVYTKTSYFLVEGEWTKAAKRLAEALGVNPEEIFADEQKFAKLKSNEAWIEMSRRQMLEMSDPLEAIEAPQVVKKLFDAACLTKRERRVLEWRNGIDCDAMTFDEVGAILDVTKETVRRIEARALRKMRNPGIRAGILPRPDKLPEHLFDQHALNGTVE